MDILSSNQINSRMDYESNKYLNNEESLKEINKNIYCKYKNSLRSRNRLKNLINELKSENEKLKNENVDLKTELKKHNISENWETIDNL